MAFTAAKRLARDLRALHTQPLPLYYLWPSDNDQPSTSNTVASGGASLYVVDVLLVGPAGTPYAGFAWRVRLDVPATYPAEPPRASFRTRIFHPNVDAASGAVCVETLKRGWCSGADGTTPGMTLADALAAVAALLMQPNPDSALNGEAAALLRDGPDAFARHARLMASIHARVPAHLRHRVDEALARGDERKKRKMTDGEDEEEEQERDQEEGEQENDENGENSENNENSGSFYVDENGYEDKENDASLSPSPVLQSPPLPIRTGVKRPLGDLPVPVVDDKENDNDNEKNIAANAKHVELTATTSSARPIAEPVKRQGLMEVNRQLRTGLPPPAKKQATVRARMGIRRL